ncbi:2-succinyl-5-enolpyruvyl-6-hydroxy-3-cyclohexene-1-carboxylate synthase [Isoptericola sp. CG 20/1183]|uniref:2-succinyl-5-enolpyruvyl-6-hydroxy-3-cyclohexene-1-carboxylate synthase n=1 Tax=Isoptericola halotolerans TaxID=300560 RepID=A0ABX5EJI2_9MICO|nr:MULTISPECIES: 2-succinyl-5-enolpyruvyl-6-hydroxy-3-cyclohexene-1-carboxylic-acid synthase [Isoptericola]PRZ09682.1 2-succinyl-5-enolpyruvyl-6-hydroxy-3-cyclohexene-1-carboxylate synthase [Isoptericola sp. CG 20/1183]PRZ10483.1 2-succinyl-5-enolpyruvyl-6-hydroxy-3-cyclohexene-1-carboxylate synthase [Isoptericola halotolerans]
MTGVPPSGSPAVEAARALVADLVAQGVRDVVLAPGSRSAPLAYALAEADARGDVVLHVRIDERSAGFLALGLSRGSALGPRSDGGTPAARPVAVVTTSGTAVANLHPAVLEAHHSGVPLVLLTADRPHELRGTGASQTTDQVGIFGTAVRAAVDVPAPDGRAGEVRDLLAVVRRTVAAARGARDLHPGPVHLDLAYRDPLHPADDGTGPVAGSAGSEATPVAESRRTVEVVPPVAGPGADPALPGDRARTLVVAGDGAGPAARRLSEAQGWPLLAEPSSGSADGPLGVVAYRSVLGAAGLADDVEHVVVLGHPTLSRPVQRLLARPDVAVTVVAPGGGPWPDAARNATRVVGALHERWFAPTRDGGAFAARWRAASDAAAAVVAAATTDEAVQGGLRTAPHAALAVARAVVAVSGADDVLVVGASNPVRDLDLVLGLDSGPAPTVLANRGLAGIDGTVSTATGVAVEAGRAGRRARALVGDLTFLHDVGGLLRGPGEPAVDLDVIVVNDDGGSIFATLEHGALAATGPAAGATFERVFGTPHGAHLAQLCAGYGVDHQLVDDVASLRHVLAGPSHGVRVIEVPVARAARLEESRDLTARIHAEVGRTLAR